MELGGHIRLSLRTGVTFVCNWNSVNNAFKDALRCPYETLCVPDGRLRHF